MPQNPSPQVEGHRETVVEDTNTHTTVHVIGGTSEVHDSNVALAKELVRVPNDKTFSARLRRIMTHLGLSP